MFTAGDDEGVPSSGGRFTLLWVASDIQLEKLRPREDQTSAWFLFAARRTRHKELLTTEDSNIGQERQLSGSELLEVNFEPGF